MMFENNSAVSSSLTADPSGAIIALHVEVEGVQGAKEVDAMDSNWELGEIQDAVRALQVECGRPRARVPDIFVRVIAKLATFLPYYGRIVRKSDGQQITGRFERIGIAGDGTIDASVVECLVTFDGFEPVRIEEFRIPLRDISEMSFHARTPSQPPRSHQDGG
ncbi:MAG: hypothetical protein V1723_03220 [Candidatus Uhrbacteria bacterium]